MKKLFLSLVAVILISNISYAEKTSIFNINAKYEYESGQIVPSSGSYKQVYTLNKDNQICLLYSKNNNPQDNFKYEKQSCFPTKYVPTLNKKDYYLAFDYSKDTSSSIIQISKDFKTITLYNFNTLGQHTTIWYGTVE